MASRVISFRVDSDLCNQIKQAKQISHLSYTDLIKRGADICVAEVQSKLNEINRLSERARRLRELIAEKETELAKSIEQEKAERQAQMDTEFQYRRAVQESDLKIARDNLLFIQGQIDDKECELAKLEDAMQTLREKRDKVSEQLVQYQQKHRENQMTSFMMMLAVMSAGSNMLQPLLQGGDSTSQNSNEVNSQRSIPANYNYLEIVKPATPTLRTTMTGLLSLLPMFMMTSMISAITSPPKKKPLSPKTEARPNALDDFIRKSREASERKLEIAEPQEVTEEEALLEPLSGLRR